VGEGVGVQDFVIIGVLVKVIVGTGVDVGFGVLLGNGDGLTGFLVECGVFVGKGVLVGSGVDG